MQKTKSRAGFSIIELMISILIGMIVVLILMQLFAQTEQWNRNTTSGGDAQNTAQITAYMLTRSLSEAGGSLLAVRARPSVTNESDEIWVSDTNSVFLPILPVRIFDNESAGDRIEVVTQSGVFGNGGLPLWKKVGNVNDPFLVRSFQGIESGGDSTDSRKSWLLVTKNDAFGDTEPRHGALVTIPKDGIAPGVAGGNEEGFFLIKHSPIPAALLGNLGSDVGSEPPSGTDAGKPSAHWIQGLGMLEIERMQVKTIDGMTGLIREKRAFDEKNYPTTENKNFEAPHVVYLKAFYGFDDQDPPTGQVTKWLAATGGDDGEENCSLGTSGWICTGIKNNENGLTAQRLIAIRFGIVVRSPQHDKSYKSSEKITLWNWNCDTSSITCPGTDPVYTVPDEASDYRYYTLQSTVPLRSAIWNVVPKP